MSGKWHVTSAAKPNLAAGQLAAQRAVRSLLRDDHGRWDYFDPAMLTPRTPITPECDADYKPEHFITPTRSPTATSSSSSDANKPFACTSSPRRTGRCAPAETILKYKGKYDAGYEAIRKQRSRT
jgi:hypothetical protein